MNGNETSAEVRRAFFNGMAASWDEMGSKDQMDEGLRAFIQSSLAPGSRTILDVGCGTGILAQHLLAAYPHAEVIVELDFAEEMLAVNRSKFKDRRLVRLVADASNLPLPDDSIDLILCFNVAPHLGNTQSAFADLLRVLTPGGTLAIGHLMSSDELNRFHGSLHGPVTHDQLIPAEELGAVLTSLGGSDCVIEERPGWYFLKIGKTA
jgi:demethylmenaquinone methyltransferase/2-methoxy-6-polyprenyl-1,4-benzoquinol methylase